MNNPAQQWFGKKAEETLPATVVKKICTIVLVGAVTICSAQEIGMGPFVKLFADQNRTENDFGAFWGDANGDGLIDLINGRHIHFNPGGDMSGTWNKISPWGDHDASLAYDLDGDGVVEIVAQNLPDVLLYWSTDKGNTWQSRVIGTAAREYHGNASQGQFLADIEAGGLLEFVIAAGQNQINYFVVPPDPFTGEWRKVEVSGSSDGTHEGIGFGDFDSDGDIDMACGVKDGNELRWWENPGNSQGSWQSHQVGFANEKIERCLVADFNGDGALDIANSCVYNGNIWVWINTGSNTFNGTVIGNAGGSSHSLDWGDIDRDGDIDLVSGTTTNGDKCTIWENAGDATFTPINLGSAGFHASGNLVDLDQDGDLDIWGYGWGTYNDLIILRNDAITGKEGTVAHCPEDPTARTWLKKGKLTSPCKQTLLLSRNHQLVGLPVDPQGILPATVTLQGRIVAAPSGVRQQHLQGTYTATQMLLDAREKKVLQMK